MSGALCAGGVPAGARRGPTTLGWPRQAELASYAGQAGLGEAQLAGLSS